MRNAGRENVRRTENADSKLSPLHSHHFSNIKTDKKHTPKPEFAPGLGVLRQLPGRKSRGARFLLRLKAANVEARTVGKTLNAQAGDL